MAAKEVPDKHECPVCLELFDLRSHRRIRCGCGRSICHECCETHLTTSTEDPHCIHCKRVWNEAFMVDNIRDTCLKSYRTFRKEVLFQRELAKMPDTQPIAKMKLRREEIMRLIREIQATSIIENADLLHDLTREFNEIDAHMGITHHHVAHIQRCPKTDCEGFIGTDYECGMCETKLCSKCLDVTCEGHECDPEKVETTKTIMRETRPCPRCATRIYKVSGCDQMWCTSCHVAFSWKTGMVETGRVHNPHFFEFMRENPDHEMRPVRAVGEQVCGGLITYEQLKEITDKYRAYRKLVPKADRKKMKHPKGSTVVRKLRDIYRNLVHLEDITINNIREYINRNEPNQDLRIDYLLKRKTADQLKNTLLSRERRRNKNRDVLHVLELFNVLSQEQYRELYEVASVVVVDDDLALEFVNDIDERVERLIERMRHVHAYVVEELTNIQSIYNMSCHMIMPVELDFAATPIMMKRREYDQRVCRM